MMVLVTGAGGFVGCVLCKQLKACGFTVRVVVRSFDVSGQLKDFEQVVVGDIGPQTNWGKAFEGVDCIVHLAARVHLMNDCSLNPLDEFRRVNRDGTVCLAEQAAEYGVQRIVYISTIKVNGEETSGIPFSEDDEPNPVDPYGISKAEAEKQLLALADRKNIEVVIIRPPLVYGPGVKANFRKMMKIVAKGIPLPFGVVDNKRSLLALDNLVDLIICCVDHPVAANNIFLAADGEDLSTSELIRRLSNALGTSVRLLPIPQYLLQIVMKLLRKGGMAKKLFGSLQVDNSKAKNLLGWVPPLSVDEGLVQTAQTYLNEIEKR